MAALAGSAAFPCGRGRDVLRSGRNLAVFAYQRAASRQVGAFENGPAFCSWDCGAAGKYSTSRTDRAASDSGNESSIKKSAALSPRRPSRLNSPHDSDKPFGSESV